MLSFEGSAVPGAYFLQTSGTNCFICGCNNVYFDRGGLTNTQHLDLNSRSVHTVN